MDASIIQQVKASAGAGKTFALTSAFLSLVNRARDTPGPVSCGTVAPRGHDWSEILAVTFTNKAAAEMRERVVKALKGRALGLASGQPAQDMPPARAARLLESVLRRYQNLNVRTIDSLLHRLMRIFALDFGLVPDFETVFDPVEIHRAVLEGFLHACELLDGPERGLLVQALDSMIGHEKKSGFWLMERIEKRFFGLLDEVWRHDGGFETGQEAMAELLAPWLAGLKDAASVLETVLEEQDLAPLKNFSNLLEKCGKLEPFDPLPTSVYATKPLLADCLAARAKDRVQADVEHLYQRFKAGFQGHVRARAVLNGAYALAPCVEIAQTLAEDVLRREREKGLVLGSRLAQRIRDRLALPWGVPDAFCRLGGRLMHLLVDEFQDTSREQWEAMRPLAVECLSKGGSLLFVGDVKQAIYGWRGGDAGLFDQVPADPELADLAREIRSEVLPRNWRSLPGVVGFNNRFFERLGDPGTALALAGTVLKDAPGQVLDDFASAVAQAFQDAGQEPARDAPPGSGHVRLVLLPDDHDLDAAERALTALEETVLELAGRRPLSEIAVLVRSNDQAAQACDRLMRAGIPVITENSLALGSHPIVRGLLAFFRFLDFPPDDAAFFEFLSNPDLFAPVSGLDRDRLFEWLCAEQEGLLYRRFLRDFPEIWAGFLEPFFREAGLMSPYDLAAEAMRVFRIMERLPGETLFPLRFLEVVHLAEGRGMGSLSAFLQFWKESGGEEKVPLPEGLQAVRIMTIHKAKGLEFPAVVLPFLDWPLRIGYPDPEYLPVTWEGRRFLCPLSRDVGEEYYRFVARSCLEGLNLLYVAFTRAQEEFHALLPARTFGSSHAGNPSLAAVSLLLAEDFQDQVSLEIGPVPGSAKGCFVAETEEAKPQAFKSREGPVELMAWLPRLRVFRHSLDEASHEERLRGECCHKAFEFLKPTGRDPEDTARAVEPALDLYPLSEMRRETLRREMTAMLLWVLGLPGLGECLAQGRPEAELVDRDGVVHRADLLALFPDRAVVLEYKTGREREEHKAQLSRYLKCVADLPGVHGRVVGKILYLDSRRVVEVLPGGTG